MLSSRNFALAIEDATTDPVSIPIICQEEASRQDVSFSPECREKKLSEDSCCPGINTCCPKFLLDA